MAHMFNIRIGILILLVVLFGATALVGRHAPAPSQKAAVTVENKLIREQLELDAPSLHEVWRIEWKTPPDSKCPPNDDLSLSCPCNGFAFGEQGVAELVRSRNGRDLERYALGSVFPDYDHGRATLKRWEVEEHDTDDLFSKRDKNEIASNIRLRPSVRLMNFADYDHDGRATEFFLPVENGGCGHEEGVVIGISRARPYLHVFGTLGGHPKPAIDGHLKSGH
jgi:hypothetical protein